uniref:Uncharacterized protein n=1 Tax=Clytia hemisphaerica TaxID=252671 RepID=A0A7M5XIP5_9CNID
MDVGRNNDSFNTFTENLNELCLKTQEQKKILKTGTTQPKTANKVTFEPALNITFDTSDSESDEDLDLNAIVNQTTSPKSPEKPLAGIRKDQQQYHPCGFQRWSKKDSFSIEKVSSYPHCVSTLGGCLQDH